MALEEQLKRLGAKIRGEGTAAGMREALSEEEFHVVLMDIELPDGDGIELIREIKETAPNVPIIMITAYGSIERAVESIREGAHDFLTKPIEMHRLEVSVQNALKHHALQSKLNQLERTRRHQFCGMIGGSPAMQVVYHIIETVAPTHAPVMITGESGVGKELVAKAIHLLSPRREREMVDLNCAAIPKDLLESELFGHERFAFTGAQRRQEGRCEMAHESTLFLDEIAEMDLKLQPKLLRFLQEQSFYRIGGKEKITVDARVISATNRNPMNAIEENALREDLYYRLNVVNIHLPPLRDRIEDIPCLAEMFLQYYAKAHNKQFEEIAPDALEALCEHPWPGNVRELQNCIQQSVVLHNSVLLTANMLPASVIGGQTTIAIPVTRQESMGSREDISSQVEENESSKKILPLMEVERQAIEQALHTTRGNVAASASALQVSPATLYRKIREYDLQLKDFKQADMDL